MTTRKPNILILMADQMTAGALAAYGGKVARTPHIDGLAERGVVFESAYCNSPLCAPSRYSFMAGRLPSAIGGYDNAANFASDVPTWAHYLRRAGYRTILSGKMHFCGADPLHGFEERLTTDIYPADFGWTPDWTDLPKRLDWYHTMDSVTQAGVCVRTNQIDFDEEVIFTARQKLFDIARGNDDRPFCLIASMTHPHDPYAIPDPWWSLHPDDAIDMPRVRMAKEDLDPHSRRIRHVIGLDLQDPTEAQIRAARRAYFGACAFVDDQIGRMLETLRATGMDQNTIVLVIADHGDMLGERGLWYKMSFFEGACRIPLIIHAPFLFPAGRAAAPASLLDLLPTLAELAGDGKASYATPIDGNSLIPALSGGSARDRAKGEVVGEYLAEAAIAPIVMIRRDRWKFVHCPGDPDQLYDLDADHDERVNLAETLEANDVVAAFRKETAARWNLKKLHRAVLSSQAQRHLVAHALRQGVYAPWDHQPLRDASNLYMRNHMKLDDLEAMARFPRP